MNFILTVKRKKERRNDPSICQVIQLDATSWREANEEARRRINQLNYRSNIDDEYRWDLLKIENTKMLRKELQ